MYIAAQAAMLLADTSVGATLDCFKDATSLNLVNLGCVAAFVAAAVVILGVVLGRLSLPSISTCIMSYSR